MKRPKPELAPGADDDDDEAPSAPGSGVRSVQVVRVVREALEAHTTPERAASLASRALDEARLARMPRVAAQLEAFTQGALRGVIQSELGAAAADDVIDRLGAFSHALRGLEARSSAPPSSARTRVMVIGDDAAAKLTKVAPSYARVLEAGELELLDRALRLLSEQRGAVVLDARDGAPWEREPLRADALAGLPVVIWGDEPATSASFERTFTGVVRVAYVPARASASAVLAVALDLC